MKDRPAFTVRWLSYAQAIRLPFDVLIADGSASDAVEREVARRGRFPDVRYDYVRYPADATYADFYAKSLDALSQVRTPFAAISDDDDFLIPDTARLAVEYLRNHPQAAACGGPWAWFWMDEGNILWKASGDGGDVDSPSATERLRTLARWPGAPVYYHVRRTADFRELLTMVRDAGLRDIFLWEQLVAFLTALAGPIRQLNRIYIGRQSNTIASVAHSHTATRGDWLDRMLAPSWSTDFSTFRRVTAAVLAERDHLTDDEARDVVTECYRVSVAPWVVGDLIRGRTSRRPIDHLFAEQS